MVEARAALPKAAIAIPLVANALAVLIWLPLLGVPDGVSIRPMLQAAALALVAFIAFILGSATAFSILPNGARRWAGWLCFLFSSSPYVVGILTLRLLLHVKQLTMAP